MTLLPWMTFLDRNGRVICTVPMRDVIRWQTAMVYGPVAIRDFLNDAISDNDRVYQEYRFLIKRSFELYIDPTKSEIPMN